MPKAVRFHEYGDVDVLRVEDVPRPDPGPGQVVVRVKAAGIQPGEATIRKGLLHDRWPATFPSGQGSDFAGVVDAVGPGVTGFAAGDEVLGFTHNRASHAEYVLAEADHLTAKPAALSWEAAGALFVVGTTAYAALRAIDLQAGETVVIAAAAGGVGSLTVQLAAHRGARVIGLASEPNHAWLTEHGAIPVAYGDGVADRIREAAGDRGVDAFVDAFGGGYVELAAKQLRVPPERIDTIADFAAAEKFGTKAKGTSDAAEAGILAELAALVADGVLEVPIAAVYPLVQVREAYAVLERRHTRGKIVLRP